MHASATTKDARYTRGAAPAETRGPEPSKVRGTGTSWIAPGLVKAVVCPPSSLPGFRASGHLSDVFTLPRARCPFIRIINPTNRPRTATRKHSSPSGYQHSPRTIRIPRSLCFIGSFSSPLLWNFSAQDTEDTGQFARRARANPSASAGSIAA